jgi:glycosyltransferase involved in cell wall biosynthesis
MRILCLVKKMPPHDGVGDYSHRLVTALRARGHVTTLLPGETLWNWRGLGRFLAACREFQADVIAFQFSPFMYGRRGICLYLIGWLAAARWLGRANVVITFHELYNQWQRRPLGWGLALLHRFQFFALGTIANALIFTTTRRHTLGRRWFFWKRSAVHRMPVGANILPLTATLHQDRMVLTTFGLLQRGVHFEELLRVVAKLVQEDGFSLTLQILGDWSVADPRRKQELENLVAAHHLREYLECSGPLSEAELSQRLASSDLYLYWRDDGPTTRSGTLAAALAHGLPVLANRAPEMDDILAQRGAVALFEDANDLRRLCAELLRQPERRADLSRRAREFAASTLGWEHIAAAYEKVFPAVARFPEIPPAGAVEHLSQ